MAIALLFQVPDAEGVGAQGAAVPERDRPAGAWQALGARHPPHKGARRRLRAQGLQLQETGELYHHAFDNERLVQPADIGWPTGNGKKQSNSQPCCLAQLCLAAA